MRCLPNSSLVINSPSHVVYMSAGKVGGYSSQYNYVDDFILDEVPQTFFTLPCLPLSFLWGHVSLKYRSLKPLWPPLRPLH